MGVSFRALGYGGAATRMRERICSLGRGEGERLFCKYRLGGSRAEKSYTTGIAVRSWKGNGEQLRRRLHQVSRNHSRHHRGAVLLREG